MSWTMSLTSITILLRFIKLNGTLRIWNSWHSGSNILHLRARRNFCYKCIISLFPWALIDKNLQNGSGMCSSAYVVVFAWNLYMEMVVKTIVEMIRYPQIGFFNIWGGSLASSSGITHFRNAPPKTNRPSILQFHRISRMLCFYSFFVCTGICQAEVSFCTCM